MGREGKHLCFGLLLRLADRPQIDPGPTPNRPRTCLKSTTDRPLTEPRSTPDRPQTDPGLTPDRPLPSQDLIQLLHGAPTSTRSSQLLHGPPTSTGSYSAATRPAYLTRSLQLLHGPPSSTGSSPTGGLKILDCFKLRHSGASQSPRFGSWASEGFCAGGIFPLRERGAVTPGV